MAVGAGYVFAGLGLSILVNRLMVVVFLYETRWHPICTISAMFSTSIRAVSYRVRLERILVDYELNGAHLEWSEPSTDLGRLTLKMKVARVHLYDLLVTSRCAGGSLHVQERLTRNATPSS